MDIQNYVFISYVHLNMIVKVLEHFKVNARLLNRLKERHRIIIEFMDSCISVSVGNNPTVAVFTEDLQEYLESISTIPKNDILDFIRKY